MSKYNVTSAKFVPGFGKQKSVVGAYVSDDNSKSNPLADSQLMAKQSGEYGGYERYSIGQRPAYRKPAPTVQAKGNIQDGQ